MDLRVRAALDIEVAEAAHQDAQHFLRVGQLDKTLLRRLRQDDRAVLLGDRKQAVEHQAAHHGFGLGGVQQVRMVLDDTEKHTQD